MCWSLADEDAVNDGRGENERNGYKRAGKDAEKAARVIYKKFAQTVVSPVTIKMGKRHYDKTSDGRERRGRWTGMDVTKGVLDDLNERYGVGEEFNMLLDRLLLYIRFEWKEGGALHRGRQRLILAHKPHGCHETARFSEAQYRELKICRMYVAKIQSLVAPPGMFQYVDLDLSHLPNHAAFLIDFDPITFELVRYDTARFKRQVRSRFPLV
jgi:hypothetical protein